MWGAGGSEAGTLDADVSMLSPSGGRLAGPEKSRVLPERSSSSPCPSPSPRLPPQARGQWAGAGQAIPSLRAASPSVPWGSSPHAAAPAPVPLINVTICSSTETLPSFSLTSDTRLGDIPPVGCALRASSAAPRFPRGAHMGCFGFFKKAHRLPSSRFTRRGESGLGIRQSAEGFCVFFLASGTSALLAGAPCFQTKGGAEGDTLEPFHSSPRCPGSSGLGLLGFGY